jgi:hypothetical protein
MTTIVVINAVSSLLAAVGFGGFLAWENRRDRRKAMVQPLYLDDTQARATARAGGATLIRSDDSILVFISAHRRAREGADRDRG